MGFPTMWYVRPCLSLCLSPEYSMTVRLLTEHHLEFLSLKVGYTGSSESTLAKCHIVGNHVSMLNYDLLLNYLLALHLSFKYLGSE